MVADVDNTSSGADILINQDANIFVSEISPSESLTMALAAGRQGYLLVMEGSTTVMLNNEECSLDRHDAAEVFGAGDLSVSAGKMTMMTMMMRMV
jgi:hypothetical protein